MNIAQHLPRGLSVWQRWVAPCLSGDRPAELGLGLSLRTCLPLFRLASLLAPVAGDLRVLGREVLGLRGGRLRRWHRAAWWGHQANHAVRLRLAVPARHDEVFARLGKVDWKPLDALAARGKGVLLVSAHHGVHQVVAAALIAAGRPALRITRSGRFQHPAVELARLPTGVRHTLLATRAFFHLREGGLVLMAPDGGHGRAAYAARFLGHDMVHNHAAAVLARRSGAPTLPVLARFEGSTIRLVFGEPIEPGALAPESWERAWMRHYLDWVEAQLRSHPQVVRISHQLDVVLDHERTSCGCRRS